MWNRRRWKKKLASHRIVAFNFVFLNRNSGLQKYGLGNGCQWKRADLIRGDDVRVLQRDRERHLELGGKAVQRRERTAGQNHAAGAFLDEIAHTFTVGISPPPPPQKKNQQKKLGRTGEGPNRTKAS